MTRFPACLLSASVCELSWEEAIFRARAQVEIVSATELQKNLDAPPYSVEIIAKQTN